jgi:hypothetical protein
MMINKVGGGFSQFESSVQAKATPEEVKLVQDALNPKDKFYPSGAEAYAKHKSYVEVLDYGTVTKVMPEDSQGSKHQLFMLKLDSGVTVRVAHNTSVAEEIPDLKVGERLGIKGEFIHKDDLNKMKAIDLAKFGLKLEDLDSLVFKASGSEMAGLLHWTHRVTQGDHESGGIVVLSPGKHYGEIVQ